MSVLSKVLFSIGLFIALALGHTVWVNHQQSLAEARGDARATQRYEVALGKQKGEASKLLAAETSKVTELERKLKDFQHEQEIQDEKNKVTVASLGRQLRTLAGPAGRLRDPNATAECGRCSAGPAGEVAPGASSGPADPADGAGLLSIELSELLLADTEKADSINNAYISCRADAVNLRETLR